MSDELQNLRASEEFSFVENSPFPKTPHNQWRCKNPNCHALLGLADPVTGSVVHIRRGGTPPGADVMIHDLGGVAIRQVCRQCRHTNWLTSEGVEVPE